MPVQSPFFCKPISKHHASAGPPIKVPKISVVLIKAKRVEVCSGSTWCVMVARAKGLTAAPKVSINRPMMNKTML